MRSWQSNLSMRPPCPGITAPKSCIQFNTQMLGRGWAEGRDLDFEGPLEAGGEEAAEGPHDAREDGHDGRVQQEGLQRHLQSRPQLPAALPGSITPHTEASRLRSLANGRKTLGTGR